MKINQDSGAFTRYESTRSPCTIHQADFEFVKPGLTFFMDPTWSTVTWVDLKTGENGMFVSNQGSNTWAAAIGPDDALYVGAWGCSDQTPAQVIRLADDGTRQIYVDGLTGQVTDVAFGPDGTLYISTFDSTQGKSTGYRFSPENNEPVKIYTVNNYIISLTVDPLSNKLLATARSKDYVLEFKSDGSFIEHRIQLPMAVADFYIDTAPDGKLYAYGSEAARQQTGPVVERWVLGLDLENGLSEKIFQFDRQGCCIMGNLSVDPQGLIWWVVDPENIIYRVTPDRKATLFAQNLPIDPAAVVVDRQGDLYFTSPSGIYRIYLEK